ncbi:MAG: XcyI family restriction endonuclease [Candidatus Aenigmarchaeota archaeon]|nr:XcyI family restriction endonuclease [Candidatus Aenigmarchaeota archaeon]
MALKKSMSPEERKALLSEAHRINYRLRSTFFYRKLHEYNTYTFPETIQKLIPLSEDYDWTKYKSWGITKEAFEQIKNSNLSLIQVFSHPRILREHPVLIAYYRNVAALSQKSVSYLSGVHTMRFELGEKNNLSEVQAKELSKLFNEHISLIIESALEDFSTEHIKGLLFASTGAQIDGSWRNAIGDEAEKVVQKLLIKEAIDLCKLTAFMLRDNHSGIEEFDKKKAKSQLDRIREFKGFTLSNKRSVIFSSEPDVSIIDKDGSTIAVIEVKGGADPAGALERYGAAKKSFEEAIRQNREVVTIFVASCITSEVEERVKKDKTIKHFYNLTALLTHEDQREEFLKHIFRKLLKC